MELTTSSSESRPKGAAFTDPAASLPQYTQLPPEEVRICVVEDNRINRKLVSNLLEPFCYTNVHMYENGQDAVDGIRLQAAEGEPYHIVLMDIAMPVMCGIEATKLIRQDENELVRYVSVIGMPATTFGHETFSAAGMTDVLLKPIRPVDLGRIIETYGNPPRLVESEPSMVELESEVNKDLSWSRPRL